VGSLSDEPEVTLERVRESPVNGSVVVLAMCARGPLLGDGGTDRNGENDGGRGNNSTGGHQPRPVAGPGRPPATFLYPVIFLDPHGAHAQEAARQVVGPRARTTRSPVP